MKKILAILFAALVTIGCLSMIATLNFVSADSEPNNSFDQAELIVTGTYSGSLIGSDTVDIYKFNVTGGQTITVKFTSSVTGTYAQQMGLHNQTQNDVLHLSSKNNVTNTGTYDVSSSISTVYFYIMVNVGPPGQEAWGNYSFQLQIGTAGNETETAALAATWLKELDISPQIDGNFCGMNAYDLQLDGWGTDAEIRDCIISQGVSGFYSNTTVYNRAMEILNVTYYEKTKWMVDGGMGLSRNVASVFAWNLIQPTKGGEYYFSVPDMSVSSAQSMTANTIGSIMPIAIWDQQDAGNKPNNNTIELYQKGSFFCIGNTTGPVGNLSAYADFIKATVERYDCDGIDDMPGLKYGIKYWEVWNEPESPGGGFKGKPGNYTQLLNATYTAVKSACADAIVVSGGALEVYNLAITQQFWKDVFAFGGGNYFDIMNIHYNTERNEQAHANLSQYNWTIEFFRNLTSSYGTIKPMWLTEIGTYTGTPSGYGGQLPYQSEQFQASWMVKHYVYALEKNVTKFFWDLQIAPGDSVFFTNEEKCQLCYYTHKLMIYKLGNFTSVEKLADGQYKFMVDGKNVYVLWGNGSIPNEITGTVNVTNIFGNITQTSASSIILSDEPIFVEKVTAENRDPTLWRKEAGIRINGSVPWAIQLPNGTYRMYYTDMGKIYSALSTDSLSWTVESGTRLTPGTGTEACIGDSSVIQLTNGTYRMYYQASENFTTHHYIASAWSQDGLSWSREGIRYNSTGTPDNGFAGTPDVIQLPNGSYRMYYVGNGGNATCALFSADTLNWAREGIALEPIALDPHVIQLHDGTYRMFYTRPKPPDIVGNLRIETAYSVDGLIWARESGVKLYPDSIYDSSVLMDPCAIELSNGTYRLYYGGQNETKIQILSAWARYLPNQTFWTNTARSNAFNLNDCFHDPDGDTITYTAYNSTHINATIADNGSVSFSAVPDWYGKENITFSAADDKGGSTEETIAVTVTIAASHAPIYISGNADFSDEDDDGVSNPEAAGTEGDPYIIEGWDIDASSADGIRIENTDVYFIIRNCIIHDGKNNWNYGIYFDSVQNGKIENATSYNNKYGIRLEASSNNNTIADCVVYNNDGYGIALGSSSNNNLTANQIYNNTCGIVLDSSSNNEIHYNNIYNNTAYGVYNDNSESQYTANATNNWWGSASGPYNPTTNPTGTGDNVTDNVIYDPWLNSPWGEEDKEPPQISNIQATPETQVISDYVNITCTVTDNVVVDKVYVNITRAAGFTPLNITMTKIAGTNYYYYNSTYSVAGDYSYYIWANDTSNNQNKSSTYQFTIIAIVTPAPISITEFVDGKEVNITGIYTGTINVTSVALPQAPPENLHYIGIQINVTIAGTLTYANITIKYNNSDVENIDETKLRMYYWDGSQWQLCNNSGVDTVNNIVWANVTHLTIFAPMAERVSAAGAAPAPVNLFLYAGITAVIVILAVSLIVIMKRRKKLEEAR